MRTQTANQSNEKSEGKPQTYHPTHNGWQIIKETVSDLYRTSWIQNLVIGVALGLIFLGLAVFVNNKQLATVAIASGFTALIWVFAIALIVKFGVVIPALNASLTTANPTVAPLPSPTNPPPPAPIPQPSLKIALEKQDAKQDKAQETLDTILATMASYQKQHAPDLANEFPLGYSLFTMKGRSEICSVQCASVYGHCF